MFLLKCVVYSGFTNIVRVWITAATEEKVMLVFDRKDFRNMYSKTSFLAQIKFITKEKHQTHIITLILN
jgi:hypothetical protein